MPDLGAFKYDNLFAGHTQPAVVGSEIITGGNFKRGTVLGLITSSNKMTIVDKAKSDGSQEVAAVLAQDIDASQQDKSATVYYTGQFNASSLAFKEGESAADYKLSLRKVGVFAVGFSSSQPEIKEPSESGVLTGFRVIPAAGQGNTSVSFIGSAFDFESGETTSLEGRSLGLTSGDKFIVMNKVDKSLQAITSEPTSEQILLCTLGFIFNPYTPDRNGTIEGIPENWEAKDLSKSSYLWHPVPVDNEAAQVAHDNFHNDNMPYRLPNSGTVGCLIPKSSLELVVGADALANYRVRADTVTQGIYFDGVKLQVEDNAVNALVKDCVIEGNNLLHYYMIKPSAGDRGVGMEAVFENITCSFFDTPPDEWNGNADLVKPPENTTFKNFLAYNCPNDAFKLELGSTYDGFEAYDLGYKTGSHCDGFQAGGHTEKVTERMLIQRGTIWMPHSESINGNAAQGGEVNGAIYVDPDFGPEEGEVSIRDLTVQNCFFNGGIHTLYVVNQVGNTFFRSEDIKFKNIMLGLDFSRSFATDISGSGVVSGYELAGTGISQWENVRRIDNGELIEKPSPDRPFIYY